MVTKEVTVKNRAGIHARPAALLVEAAARYECQIFIVKDGARINAKSIMGILTLGASYNSTLEIEADGENEESAVETLVQLFENRFEED